MISALGWTRRSAKQSEPEIEIEVTTLSVPKLQTIDSENDDAFDSDGRLFAVADGATQSYLSGRWARRLVRDAVASPTFEAVPDAVRHACHDWTDVLDEYVTDREASGRPIKYYEEPKIAKGSHAALAIVEVLDHPEGERIWRAWAVGDVCVFRVSADVFVQAFPLTSKNQFDNIPDLVSTKQHSVDDPKWKIGRGVWQPGDRLFILSDAIAYWFLQRWADVGAGRSEHYPWALLERLVDNPDLFRTWIDTARQVGEVRDDDVTVTCLRLGKTDGQ